MNNNAATAEGQKIRRSFFERHRLRSFALYHLTYALIAIITAVQCFAFGPAVSVLLTARCVEFQAAPPPPASFTLAFHLCYRRLAFFVRLACVSSGRAATPTHADFSLRGSNSSGGSGSSSSSSSSSSSTTTTTSSSSSSRVE